MYSLLKKVTSTGTHASQSMTDRQSILVSNYYALSLFSLAFLIGSAFLIYYHQYTLRSFLYVAGTVSLFVFNSLMSEKMQMSGFDNRQKLLLQSDGQAT